MQSVYDLNSGASIQPTWHELLSHVEIIKPPGLEDSKAFLQSQDDLTSKGYIEEEYFVSGLARTYEWIGNTANAQPISAPGAYTTRILVCRPIDAARFSGNIAFETLNSSAGLDVTTTMATSADSMMSQGDVWIGVTSKSLTLNALKKFDPVRYAPLHWSNPTPPEHQCRHPSIIPEYTTGSSIKIKDLPPISTPESEDGLIWDIYAQIGAFLKGEDRTKILPGFRHPRIFATGYSQSCLIQRTFITAFHNMLRTADGGPIFDGYLAEAGPAALRINQCSTDILPGDPRNLLPLLDVPVIHIVSEGDMWLGVNTRQPDVIKGQTGLATYEIAGASHKPGFGERGRPTAAEAAQAGLATPLLPLPQGITLNDIPRGYLSAAALRNLQAWALTGVAPPQAPRIETHGEDIARDGNGNAIGGVRSPWIDVPTASYRGGLGTGAAGLSGQKFPFSRERLLQLYPDHDDYVAKVRENVAQAVAERWLLASDGALIIQAAQAAHVP